MRYYEIDFYNLDSGFRHIMIDGYMSGISFLGKFETKNQARKYLKDNGFKMIDKDHYTSPQGGTQATIYNVRNAPALLSYAA